MIYQRGLTLIELMVTLAVAIVLLAIGIPSFDRLGASNRLTGQTNALVSALNLARSEALARGLPVAVCAKASPSPANTNCGAATDWVNGWQVFLDNGSNIGSYNSANEQLVRVFSDLAGPAAVTASAAAIRFARDGTLDSTVHAGVESFRMAQSVSGASQNCVQLSVVGQISTDRIGAADSCP